MQRLQRTAQQAVRTPLTRTTMESHGDDNVSTSDQNYTEALIRAEGTRLFERAVYDYTSPRKIASTTSAPIDHPSNPDHKDVTIASIGLGSRYYAPKASLMTPLERFLVLSPENDSFALAARLAMAKSGVSVGSLETLDIRHEAARRLAAEVQHRRVPETTAKL